MVRHRAAMATLPRLKHMPSVRLAMTPFPHSIDIEAPAEDAWATVTLPLTGFAGADFSTLRGISFTATAPPGEFQFAIDDVELR